MLCTVASPLPPKLAAAVRDTGTGGGRIQPSRASERELGATFQAGDACCRKSRCRDPDRRHCSRLQNSNPNQRGASEKKKQPAGLRFSKKLHHLFACVLIVSSSHSSLVQFAAQQSPDFSHKQKPPRQRESLSPKQQAPSHLPQCNTTQHSSSA